MPPPSKRKQQTNDARGNKKRKSRSKAATYKRNKRESQKWKSELLVLKSSCKNLSPHNSRIYSLQDNVLLIQAIVGCLERKLNKNSTITWTSIDREVSSIFHVRLSHITWLRELFIDEGQIRMQEVIKRGCGVGSTTNKSTKVNANTIKKTKKCKKLLDF